MTAATIAIALITALPAVHAVKPGTTCKKAGQTTVFKGKTYTCVKSGKKVVWNKGVANSSKNATSDVKKNLDTSSSNSNTAVQTPFITETVNPTYMYLPPKTTDLKPQSSLSNPEQFLNWDLCKLVEAKPWGVGTTSGFFQSPERVKLYASPKIQIVPVDFTDVVAKNSPESDFASTREAIQDFYSRAAGKKINFRWHIPEKYLRMSKSLKEYDIGGNFFAKTWSPTKYNAFLEKVFAEVDSKIDFSDTSAVIVITPPTTPSTLNGTFMVWPLLATEGYETQEGKIYNVLGRGGEFINEYTYIHEFGHALGLVDPRDVSDVADQKSGGLGIYDVMAGGVLPELLVWHRFTLEILGAEQLHCVQSKESSTHWLRPVTSQDRGAKGVVIPLDANTGLVVETRRREGYDYLMGRQSEGVIVYEVDTTKVHPKSPYVLVRPSRSIDRQWERDAALKPGEFVDSNGWRITVIESGDFGDVIKVENRGGRLSNVKPTALMKPSETRPCGFRCKSENLVNKIDQPQLTSLSWNNNKLTVTVKLSKEIQGAFAEVKSLSIGRNETQAKVDGFGYANLEILFPIASKGNKYEVFLYSYKEDITSPCCTSIGIQVP